MRKDAEDEDSRDGRRKGMVVQGAFDFSGRCLWKPEEENDQSWSKQLRQVCEDVLVVGMQAVFRQVRGLCIVRDIINRCYYRCRKKISE